MFTRVKILKVKSMYTSSTEKEINDTILKLEKNGFTVVSVHPEGIEHVSHHGRESNVYITYRGEIDERVRI